MYRNMSSEPLYPPRAVCSALPLVPRTRRPVPIRDGGTCTEASLRPDGVSCASVPIMASLVVESSPSTHLARSFGHTTTSTPPLPASTPLPPSPTYPSFLDHASSRSHARTPVTLRRLLALSPGPLRPSAARKRRAPEILKDGALSRRSCSLARFPSLLSLASCVLDSSLPLHAVTLRGVKSRCIIYPIPQLGAGPLRLESLFFPPRQYSCRLHLRRHPHITPSPVTAFPSSPDHDGVAQLTLAAGRRRQEWPGQKDGHAGQGPQAGRPRVQARKLDGEPS